MLIMRTVLESVCWCVLLVILFCIPLLNGAYYNYQWLLFSGATFALFTGYLTLLAVGQSYNKKALLKAAPLLLLMLLQVLWLYLQASPWFRLVSSSDVQSLYGVQKPDWFEPLLTISFLPIASKLEIIKSLFYVALFFMLLGMTKSKKRLIVILSCMAISGSMHAAIGLISKFMQIHLVELQSLDGHWSEARGLFVNRNHFAAFINLCLVCLMVYPVRAMLKNVQVNNVKSGVILILDVLLSARSIILFLVIMCVAALLLSTSRAATLSLLFGVGFWSLLLMLIDSRSKGLKTILVLMIVIFSLALLWLGGDTMLDRVHAGALDIGERGLQWKVTMLAITDYWLLGTGAGTYQAVFQFYRIEHDALRQVVFDQAHSEYLQILLEQGVIGFVLWLTMIAYIFKLLVTAYIEMSSTLMKAVVFCCLVGLTTALIQALVDFNLQMPAIRTYFYSLLALGIVATQIYKNTIKNNV